MKKFKFRLEKVLQYRELLKEDKRRELLTCNLRLQEAKDLLERLEKAALSNKLDQEKIVTVEEVLLSGLFAERLKDQIVNQRIVIVEKQQEVNTALQAYVEASKEARSLEMLKERKLQQYMEYLHKEDEKFLDEMAVQRGNQILR